MNDNSVRKNPLKEELEKHTKERIEQYKLQVNEVLSVMKLHPETPYIEQVYDKAEVMGKVAYLRSIYFKILPYIKRVKKNVNDITDQSKVTAIYLLFGKASQEVNAIFTLLENGFHYESMELVRTLHETLDLISHFININDDNKDLKKWFDGKFIKNESSRDSMQDFFNNGTENGEEPVQIKEAKAGIYGGLSNYSHVTYSAILDSFDVFHQDFDFEKIAGYHYVNSSSIPYVRTELIAILITLKHFYGYIKDLKTYNEIDKFLNEIAPEMKDKDKVANLMELFKRKYK